MTELALAEWHQLPGQYTQEELERLAFAWLRRKKLEARLIAAEVWTPLNKEKRQERVTPEDMWALLGEVTGNVDQIG